MTEAKTRPAPWSDAENAALVALYFVMLDKATAGKPYNKAAMIRAAQAKASRGQGQWHDKNGDGILRDRSKQSIEFKLMNATAAHRDLTVTPDGIETAETMHGHGYRAMPNYQATLREAMSVALRHRRLSGRGRKRYAGTQFESDAEGAA